MSEDNFCVECGCDIWIGHHELCSRYRQDYK